MSAFDGADWTCQDDISRSIGNAIYQFRGETGRIAQVVYLGVNEHQRVRLHAHAACLMPVYGDMEHWRLCGLRIVLVNEPRYFAVGL